MIPTIPESALPDVSNLNTETQPGYTYKLDLNAKRIAGHVDHIDAVTQMVFKTLYTERYAWLIYNWDWGAELEQYFGKSMDFVMADIGLTITEALDGDDRVLSIQEFSMQKTAIDALYVEFTVSSTQGDTRIGLEVPL